MRDAMRKLGGDPKKINPLLPAELVIDHSVQVDKFGTAGAFAFNADLEIPAQHRALRLPALGTEGASKISKSCRPTPASCHQVNLEYLARVVFSAEQDGKRLRLPRLARRHRLAHHDGQRPGRARLGRRRHRSRGRHARPAALDADSGGGRLQAARPLPEGATATDLVLTVTQMLRKKGVVGKFVEFYGTGLSSLTLADRATIANMAPEYGATMGFFPVDAEDARLPALHRPTRDADGAGRGLLQGAGNVPHRRDARPGVLRHAGARSWRPWCRRMAGPKRPQDRVPLTQMPKVAFDKVARRRRRREARPTCRTTANAFELGHGAVVIAAITSCTNTSNPS